MKKKEYKKRLEKEKKAMRELQEPDANKSLKNVIIITISVVAFIFIMFAFTKIKTGEWNLFTRKNNITYSAEVQTTKILCGQVLNRSSNDYYVLAYEMQEDSVSLYDSILERYNLSTNNILPVYKLDLSNTRNNICKSSKVNISNNIKELKLSVPTLIRVKDGKIINTYTDYETIKNTLYSYVD